MPLFPIADYLRKDLTFKNLELEKKYSRRKQKYQRNILYIELLFGFLIGVIGGTINENIKAQYEGAPLIYRMVLMFFFLLFSVIACKKPNHSEKLIIGLTLIYFFGFMETSFANMAHWSNLMHFLTGMNTQFILGFTIIAKVSWKSTCFLSILINAMHCFRYTYFEENYKINFYPLFQYILSATFITAAAFLFEKDNRESYYKVEVSEFYLAHYKDLIKNLVSCSVIITRAQGQGQNILFNNKESLKLFGCLYAGEVWEKLETVKLEISLPKKEEGRKRNLNPIFEDTQENDNAALFEKQTLTLQELVIAFSKNHKLTEKSYKGEYEQAGSPKALNISVTEIFWENNNALLIVINENLLMQKMNLMREEALYKNRLLTTARHDFRTPLAGIIGIAAMILELVVDREIRKYLKILHRSSKSLIFVIDNLLDYTRLSINGIILNKERISLWDCIEEVSDLFKYQIKLKNIRFERRNLITTNNYRAFINTDKERVKQVLHNLLGNSMKYTVQGFIKITLKESTALAYVITVEDSGIGIKKENQHNIFELFGILRDTENKDREIGLGLPLSQRIVKMLNNNKKDGVIKFQSEYNKGSLFSFVLYHNEPYELEGEPNTIIVENSKKIYEAPTMKKFNMVLIIASKKSNTKLIVEYLKSSFEFIYDEAVDSQEALTIIKLRASSNLYYNLILVDCDSSSYIAFQMINLTKTLIVREEIPFVPMIGICSEATREHFNRFQGMYMNDYILKPFTSDLIKLKLEKYFI